MLNGALVAVVAAGGGLAYTLVGNSSTPAKAGGGRTVAVQRGTVLSQVSASGNVALAAEVGLNFGASGQITEIDVHAGDHVKAGQVLAKIDPTAANQQLTTAQAALTSAQASLAKLQQGQTAAQQALAAQQLKSATDSLAAAKTSFSDAQAAIAADATNLQNAIDAANATLATDQATQNLDCAAPAKPSCAADQNTVLKDQNAVTQATNAKTAGAQKDTTSLHQAQNSLTQAQNSYNTSVDQQAVSNAPATPDQIASAQAAVVTAQNNLAAAQKAVAGTVLTAPSDSTVLTISSGVGTSVSAGTSSTSSSSSSSSSSSGGAKASGAAYQYSLTQVGTANYLDATYRTVSPLTRPRALSPADPTAFTAAAQVHAAGSGVPALSTVLAADGTTTPGGGAGGAGVSGTATGFMVLGDMTQLTVKAEFAETDAAKLKAGQQATVSLNALPGQTFGATVESVDPTSTVVSNVVEYGATLQLTVGQQGLDTVKPGQTASVQVTTDAANNTLYVPSSAVVTAGGQTTVTVVNGSTQTPTPVTVGVVGDSTTEILTGLNEGDQVLLSPRGTSSSGGTTGGRGGTGTGGGGFGGAGGGGFGGAGGGTGL